MKIAHYDKTKAVRAKGEEGVRVRWVIAERDGAPNFAMRVIEVQPGHATSYHTHSWEHEVYVLSGRGAVKSENGETPIAIGDVVYVHPEEVHQFANRGEDLLSFICVIPLPSKIKEAEQGTEG
jgi:quercetin dioxygenase-like cupin family protein